jgi:hypothetical protein
MEVAGSTRRMLEENNGAGESLIPDASARVADRLQ